MGKTSKEALQMREEAEDWTPIKASDTKQLKDYSKNVLPDELRQQLRRPFPPEAVAPIPGRTYLTTVKAIYITERLNDVFGIGGWTLETEIISDSGGYVLVKGSIILFNWNIRTPLQYGGHKATGEIAEAYKSAITDIQSKSASYLEIAIDVFKGRGEIAAKEAQQAQQAPKAAPKAKPAPKPGKPKEKAVAAANEAPEPKAKPEGITEEALQDIKIRVEKTGSKDELEKLFREFPQFKQDKDFVTLFIDRAQELEPVFAK